ncbi:prephenate dehydrogenase (NADP(+)) [Blastocladiella emersonii ATCC 22665]|nr:prephenate dehydrogenase (NADP(+)) [Blastocladiella emersonii ATCC 22665]
MNPMSNGPAAAAAVVDKSTFEIGIIGMGDMGRLYARRMYAAGWTKINVCDLPDKTEALRREFPEYNVVDNGHLVSRRSDLVIYSVEAKFIADVVKAYGPSTKVGAIVGGQTSVKAPEIAAFEAYLPADVHIVTMHSMHGPNVSPRGQPLVLIPHRATPAAASTVEQVLACLESKLVRLSAAEHDRVTADTQAVTHLAFKSMGSAWKTRTSYPWEDVTYVGGVDNVKVAMTLRIYSNKWHVYAGLALLNPAARRQIAQYASSVEALFALMITENEAAFRARVEAAAQFVFGDPAVKDRPLLLADALLDQYTLAQHDTPTPTPTARPSTAPSMARNSHLSLLAMVDCWHALGINPYQNLICQTPPFRLWLGIVEYVFRTPAVLEAAVDAALHCKELRADDLAFVAAAAGWAQTILQGHFDSYQARFEDTQAFFADRLEDGRRVSAKIIETVAANMRAEEAAVAAGGAK